MPNKDFWSTKPLKRNNKCQVFGWRAAMWLHVNTAAAVSIWMNSLTAAEDNSGLHLQVSLFHLMVPQLHSLVALYLLILPLIAPQWKKLTRIWQTMKVEEEYHVVTVCTLCTVCTVSAFFKQTGSRQTSGEVKRKSYWKLKCLCHNSMGECTQRYKYLRTWYY